MNIIPRLLAILSLNLLLAVSARAENIIDTVSDKIINKQVEFMLVKEHDIPNTKIEVNTENGIVYLNGKVETRLQANRVIELAASVNGVKDVNSDELTVKSSSEFLSDSLITAKAKGRIKYLALNKRIREGYDLHVETTNKVVHIFGNVEDPEDMEKIRSAVKEIISIKDVKMNIKCP